MAVAKRQGRSKEGPRTRVRTAGRKALLTKPNLQRASPEGRNKHIKRGAKALSHGFSLSRVRARALSLSLPLPAYSSTLFSLSLWVDMPSHFEDGFSCYLLNKIEL